MRLMDAMVMPSMSLQCSCLLRRGASRGLLHLLVLFGMALLSTPTFGWQMKFAPIMTDWAQLVNTNSPLPEYPRPQMVRSNWLNLNGIWQFQSGATNDPVPTNQTLAKEILVPFP